MADAMKETLKSKKNRSNIQQKYTLTVQVIKIWQNLTIDLIFTYSESQTYWAFFFQIFVAFLDNLNFTLYNHTYASSSVGNNSRNRRRTSHVTIGKCFAQCAYRLGGNPRSSNRQLFTLERS